MIEKLSRTMKYKSVDNEKQVDVRMCVSYADEIMINKVNEIIDFMYELNEDIAELAWILKEELKERMN